MKETCDEEFLKVDARGYVRVPRERREMLLDEFERCGVSAVQFATQIGVKYQTFAHWRQMRNNARRSREPGALVSAGVGWSLMLILR